jgi:hypothetical protein
MTRPRTRRAGRHEYDPDFDPGDAGDGTRFADPGGRSALRAAGRGNPRNRPCPSCGRRNMLTPADVARGYQCDRCSDRTEMGLDP